VPYSAPAPLGRAHEIGDFACGEASLDIWLRRHARQAHASGSARVFVTTSAADRVVGYYALAAGAVEPADATPRLKKGQPAARAVPVVVLARLAIDVRHQGRGLGASLLQDALLRCAGAADSVGVRAVVVHALSAEARSFYLRFGFERSPTDPLHLILLMKDLRRLLDSFR